MTPPAFGFQVLSRDGAARRGRLATPHGPVQTPAFAPVATFGAVRGVAPDELESLGAEIALANTYHLHERPGEDAIRELGGLHGFTGWRRPWLTDSGGYQVTSLLDRVRVDEAGVVFTSPLDGRPRQLTPEGVVAIQQALGSDIAMVLDECRPEASGADGGLAARAAMERTLRWAERSAQVPRSGAHALFGIVQGGSDPALRRASARATAALGFDGYAHGGLGLGEAPDARAELVACANQELPAEAPRYLMGLGRPVDLADAVAGGIDLFDCVLPTRNGRHGLLFTRGGLLRLRNARHRRDPRPPDPACACPTCSRFSRAYLRHLLQANEMLGARLASVHNLHFYLGLMASMRAAIEAGRFEPLHREIRALSEVRAE